MSKCPCGFCHLHVYSEYSLLDGANQIKDIAKRAAEMDMPAIESGGFQWLRGFGI